MLLSHGALHIEQKGLQLLYMPREIWGEYFVSWQDSGLTDLPKIEHLERIDNRVYTVCWLNEVVSGRGRVAKVRLRTFEGMR